jgi:hypothetical protein
LPGVVAGRSFNFDHLSAQVGQETQGAVGDRPVFNPLMVIDLTTRPSRPR